MTDESSENIPELASKTLEKLLVPIDSIRPNPDNYKEHPEEQLESLHLSYLTFNWTKPICADSQGLIVAGHGMYLLAKKLGFTHVPVEPLAFTKNQSKAYLLADNETARKGVTIHEKMIDLLGDISDMPEIDVEATGYTADEVNLLLNLDGDFSFDLAGTEDGESEGAADQGSYDENEGEPADLADVEGKRCGMSYAVHITFKDQETAEIFLAKIKAPVLSFTPGRTSTIIKGDELEL